MSGAAQIARGESAQARPQRVVALGGGTGLPGVLRGLRGLVDPDDRSALTAVVTMTDDGGSSGRLRASMGMPPPGDVRNCLVALAEQEDLLAGLFQYRYDSSPELDGHSLGNLILAALARQTGSFLKAVEVSSSVLRTAGRILPATDDDVRLEAVLDDGATITGETRIASCGRRIRRIRLNPETAHPTPGVVDSIMDAGLVVIGPGSLYTSLVPNIVVGGVAEALRRTAAPVVLVANLVSERGEAAGLDLPDHVDVIEEHAGGPIIDGILVHAGPIDGTILERYRSEGATPLRWPAVTTRRLQIVERDLRAPGPKLRHEPAATAAGLMDLWTQLMRGDDAAQGQGWKRTVKGGVDPSHSTERI